MRIWLANTTTSSNMIDFSISTDRVTYPTHIHQWSWIIIHIILYSSPSLWMGIETNQRGPTAPLWCFHREWRQVSHGAATAKGRLWFWWPGIARCQGWDQKNTIWHPVGSKLSRGSLVLNHWNGPLLQSLHLFRPDCYPENYAENHGKSWIPTWKLSWRTSSVDSLLRRSWMRANLHWIPPKFGHRYV